MTKFETFRKLHEGSEAFILPNAWNAQSAAIFQDAGYQAVGTSSAAVATSLGYADGENMPFSEYLMIVRRILASVDIPVTIDMEMGFGKKPDEVYTNLKKLTEAGVAGINIEDSLMTNGTRDLKAAGEFAELIGFLKTRSASAGQPVFVNVRCDTYLLNVKDAERETARRLKIYGSAGADGIFLPLIREEQAIATAVSNTTLPLNVMAVPGIPDVDQLSRLGVKRVSMGPFFNTQLYRKAKELAVNVAENKSLKSILY